ncbi:hypothetical protein J7F03_11020 [Streptomyces sp. ISL-43]|uniref:DUF937 domain-containing protein n=1 Tax=Streptomyces sp. ISL-43 TaxID=2819183 RepID=UPI001BE67548|nr:DUF937 domain-containing protein [Streptomyces sp. ISL-43]MBT2447600.1 hypothetical protein [Streptomyces sp. ISL-43]
MSEPSIQDDVLSELGDDRLTDIAGLLGTDTNGARDTVAATVGAMTGDLQQKADADDDDGNEVRQAFAEVAEAPLEGVATLGGGLGGMLGGGMMAGVLAKVSKPVANAVSKKTGIPAPTVARVIELLIPVLLAVFAKRAAAGKGGGGGAAPQAAGADSPIPSPGAVPGGAGAAPGAPSTGGGLGDLLSQILGGGKK